MKPRSIGELFLGLRNQAGLTQLELESKGGPKQSVISRLERGDSDEPSDETVRKYAAALKIDVDSLREQIAAIQRQNEAPNALRMGFLNGLGAAPIIAMVMDGKSDMRSSSTFNSLGPIWHEPRVRPSADFLDKDKPPGAPYFAESLFDDFDLQDLDLIVAPSARFASSLGDGRPLVRCAQLCPESLFVFMVFKYVGGSDESIDKGTQQLEKHERREYWKIDRKKQDGFLSLRYISGTLGEDYATLLVKPFGSAPIARSFNQGTDLLEGFRKMLEEEKQNEIFRAIVSFPLAIQLKQTVDSEPDSNWRAEFDELADVYAELQKQEEDRGFYEESFPSFSVDILLRRDSDRIIEWIVSANFMKFMNALLTYEDGLGSSLRADHKIVRNVADYLRIPPEECAGELRKSKFTFLLYPEFLHYFDRIRNRRLV